VPEYWYNDSFSKTPIFQHSIIPVFQAGYAIKPLGIKLMSILKIVFGQE
jgi:hypothetical protein